MGGNPLSGTYIAVIAKRSAVYAALIGGLIGTFIIVVTTAEMLFGPSPDISLIITSCAIALAAVGFAPLEHKLQEWTDKVFFRKRSDHQSILQGISKAMTHMEDLSELYDILPRHICQDMRLVHAELYIKEDGRYVSVGCCGSGQWTKHIEETAPLINELKNTGQLLSRKDIPGTASAPDQPRLVLPFCSPEDMKGFLVLGEKRSAEPFYREDLTFLQTLAHQVLIGMARIQSQQLSEDRVLEMRTVSDVGRLISSSLDLRNILDTVVRTVSEVVDVDRGMFLLYNAETDELQAKAGYGALPEDIARVKLSVKDSIFGRIFTEGKAVRKRATRQTEFVKRLEAEEYIAVPMKGKDKVIGLLAVDNQLSKRPLDGVNMELLITLANQTGLAIENALLYEQTREMKNYNENILKYMTSGVITVDTHGKILTFNRAAEKITGLTAADVQNKDIGTICPQGCIIAKALQGPCQNLQGVFTDRSGTEKQLALSTVELRQGNGNNGGMLTVMSDISELKHLESQVRRADRLSILGTMAAGLAHEIKNPLASMKLFVQLMSESWQDPNFWTMYGNIMNSEVERLCQVVEDFLGFARSYDLKLDASDIRELFAKVHALLKTQMINANVHLELHAPEQLPQVMLDHQRMTQVFMNLILNAMQAMPEERADKRIRIELIPAPGAITVQLSDNGAGITPENLEKLFTPFFTTKKKGTGLGLSIVQRIIEEHGGKISVKSTVNVGTTFTMILPTAEKSTRTEKVLELIENTVSDPMDGIEDGTANTVSIISNAFIER